MENMKNKYHIYYIKNLVNKKIYIGKTIQSNPNKRWIRHKSELKSNIHSNKHLQRSFNKYGINCFEFKIMEEIENNFELLNEREIYWINFYNANNEQYGYNKTSGGDGGSSWSEERKRNFSLKTKGRIKTEEEKIKLSKSLMGRVSPNKGKKLPPRSQTVKDAISKAQKGKKEYHNNINLIAINIETKIIIGFRIINDAAIFLNTSSGNIRNSYKNNGYCKGYILQIDKHNFEQQHIELVEIAEKMCEKLNNQKINAHVGIDNKMSKKVINNKTKIIYDTIREAAEKEGFNYSTLKSKLNGNNPNNTDLTYCIY